MPDQYTCAVCGETYNKTRDGSWSDEKAEEELQSNFGPIPLEECDIVCDSCYKRIMNQ